MEELQNGLSERAQWFRVGMVSATVLTPLITRWQSLRAAERARDLWESRRAGARWPWTTNREEVALPALARRQNLSAGVWLVGAGVGLLVAGTVAYVVARRRIISSDEAPLELTLEPGSDGGPRPLGERARELVGRSARGSGTAAPTGASDGRDLRVASDTELAAPDGAVETAAAPSDEPDTAPPDEAQFIGDVKTLLYHEADGENLPIEENRVYFADREQAEAAGFRPVKGELAPGEVAH